MTVSDNHTIIKYADNRRHCDIGIHLTKIIIIILAATQKPPGSQHGVQKTYILLINTKKTKELVFCNQRDDPDPPSVMINNAAIERVEEHKYLGTTISRKLNFNTNTRNIIDKANKRLFIIKQLAYMNAQTSTITLAYTTFLINIIHASYMDASHLIRRSDTTTSSTH